MIRVLEKEVYELIAAGEVVSRPKFVVKELVENSIDAEAKSIDVEIKNGGKTLIRVVDDGAGMSFDDCRVAFLRHATSKILSKNDLDAISTLGFRGEALASICAVSEVEVLTRQIGSELGTHYFNRGGEAKFCEKVNCNKGTIISVSELFYNVPARMKFLKSDSIEANLIQDILEKLAISCFDVAFSFKKNGKKIFQTTGNKILADAIYNIFGKAVFETLIPVKNFFSGVEVEGFVSLPKFCRARGSMSLSFVNSRYVKSKIFKNGVEQAFKGFAMVGKFPSFVLFLRLPYSDVDVNVHPAKIEAVFSDESVVLKAIYLAVRKAIEKSGDVFEQKVFDFNSSSVDFKKSYCDDSKKISDSDMEKLANNFVECAFLSGVKPYKLKSGDCDNKKILQNRTVSDCFNFNESTSKCASKFEVSKKFKNEVKNETFKTEGISNLKLIGEVFKTYILAEYMDKLIVVDKHAAHERIIYEKLRKRLNSFERQVLLTPLEVSMNSESDWSLVFNNLNIFRRFGFELDSFGLHNFLIREIPAILDKKNSCDVFYEIVQNLKQSMFDLTPETVEKILHTIACRSATKANDDSTKEQLFELVKAIYSNENIRTCPHGRPVILVFPKSRFDSDFRRK